MRLRPGASEVYRVTVRCELVEGANHAIQLRLKADNRVTFEGACDWRTARAVEKLSDAVTCRTVIAGLKRSIRSGDGWDVYRCRACTLLVVPRATTCPACGDYRRYDEVPAWSRICRDGRVS